jgi:hypothetical protein
MGSCPDSGRTQHLLVAANTRKSVRLLAEALGIRVLTNGTGVPSKLILFVDDTSSYDGERRTLARAEIAVSELPGLDVVQALRKGPPTTSIPICSEEIGYDIRNGV